MDPSEGSEQAKRLADIFSQAAAFAFPAIQEMFGQSNMTRSSHSASTPTLTFGQSNRSTSSHTASTPTLTFGQSDRDRATSSRTVSTPTWSSSDDEYLPTPKRSRRDTDETLGILSGRLHTFRRVLGESKTSRKKPTFSQRSVIFVPRATVKTPTPTTLSQLKAQGLGLASEKVTMASDMTREELVGMLELQYKEVDFTDCHFAKGLRARKLEFADDLPSLTERLGHGSKIYVVLAAEHRTTQSIRNQTQTCTITSGALLQMDQEQTSHARNLVASCTATSGSVITSGVSQNPINETLIPSISWESIFAEEYVQTVSDDSTAIFTDDSNPFVHNFTSYLEALSAGFFVEELSETLSGLRDSFFSNQTPSSNCFLLCPVLISNYSLHMTRFFSRLSKTETMIKVNFIGQTALDLEGPRRQALSGYLKEIVNRYIVGDEARKIIVQELTRIADGSYVAFGKAIGLALLLDKIRFNCLAMAQVCFLVGGMGATRALPFLKLCEAIDDPSLRNSLAKVYKGQAISSEEAVVISEMTKRDIFGHPTQDRCKKLALDYIITSRLGALLGLKQGLDVYGVTETMKTRMELAASLMSVDVPLTAEVFYEMLQPQYSVEGSNSRALEMETVSAFYLVLPNAASGMASFSLENLLMFSTGYEKMPAENIFISLEFSSPERLPEARTCGPTLILPTITGEDELEGKLACEMTNYGGGFGNI